MSEVPCTRPEYITLFRSSSCYEVWRRWPGSSHFTVCVATCASGLEAESIRNALAKAHA